MVRQLTEKHLQFMKLMFNRSELCQTIQYDYIVESNC